MDDSMEAFLEATNAQSRLRVEADLGDGFVRLRSDEAQRRQAIHDIRSTEDIVIELLRNSRDAHAHNIYLATGREGDRRTLVVVDDGEGIPESMHARVFEPRVTSKLDTMSLDKWGVHGRGMALYSIEVNAESAQVVSSRPGGGCALAVSTDVKKLGEKRDQSSFPVFQLGEAGAVAVRGPKNILRVTCEFALDARKQATVYLGSATEIAAALYACGKRSLSAAEAAFAADPAALPCTERLAAAADPAMFRALASTLGLTLSERSARRIMDGAIAPAAPVLEQLACALGESQGEGAAEEPKHAAKPRRKSERALALSPDDVAAFAGRVQEAFRDIARDYYLEADVIPVVRVEKDAVRITIPVEKQR